MAKFLDLTGLSQFKDKIQEWANGAFRKITDKISTDDVTYNGDNLTTAITSGEFKGEKGDQGPQGLQGVQGEKGETGAQGPQGIQGPKGDPGEAFTIAKTYESVSEMNSAAATDGVKEGQFVMIDTGNIEDEDNAKLYVKSGNAYSYITDLSGATGMTGPQGPEGAQGPAGQAGEQGPQGPKGEQGIQGETGPAGAAATVSVGEVTSGDTAKVTNSGNANAAVFDFVLPRGPQGPQGIQGPAGPQGPAGSDANVEAITEGEIDALFSA